MFCVQFIEVGTCCYRWPLLFCHFVVEGVQPLPAAEFLALGKGAVSRLVIGYWGAVFSHGPKAAVRLCLVARIDCAV